jgi:hypothetical protein
VASIVLAVVLPILFVVGLGARTSIPTDERRAALQVEVPRPDGPGVDLGALWEGLPIDLRLWTGAGGAPDVLEVAPTADPVLPDALVLWSPGTPPAPGGEVSPDARRLGRLAGLRTLRFALPPEATGRRGSVLVYSLARNELVAAAALGGG